MKKLNNKGSTMVLVTVTLAIVGILAVVALWITLINYEMKITDSKVKDNFYSAESVLDQICTGLQNDVSDAYNFGYDKVMQNYTMLDEDGRQSLFAQNYVNKLRMNIKSSSGEGSDLRYDLDKLKGYVASNLLDTNKYPYAVIESTSDGGDGNGDGLLTTYETGLLIKGIKVTFYDEKGYSSIIETDINLAIPAMNFTTSEGLPDIFSYSLIGNSGLKINDEKVISDVDIQGNVYAGSAYVVDPSKTDDLTSVSIPNGTTVTVSNTAYFIAEGNVEIGSPSNKTNGTNSLLDVAADCQLWTENINVNGARLKLRGNSYVSDDLTIYGVGSKVSLGESGYGKYVGYGNSDELAEDSSAIIINGKDSSVDLSGLKELLLAGYAYINTGKIASNKATITNTDIQTGESISVKGNQIAYLVPAECIGTEGSDKDAKSHFGRNPLTYKEYQVVHGSASYTEINDKVKTSKTGKTLSDYINGGDVNDYIKTIMVPGTSGDSNDGFVYYYINLPADNAMDYYRDFYDVDKTKLELYTKFYTNMIKSGDAASRIYTVGNYSIYDNDELDLMKGVVDGIDVDAESATLSENYMALNSKLITNYAALTANELSATLYTNIINEENLTKVTSGTSGTRMFEVTTAKNEVYKAVVCSGSYDYNGSDLKIKLIVANGDVNVSSDFEGTIICKGKINIMSGCKVKASTEEVFKRLLSAAVDETDENTLHLYDVFDEGSAYMTKSVAGEIEDDDDSSSIAYSDIITYKNWKKE